MMAVFPLQDLMYCQVLLFVAESPAFREYCMAMGQLHSDSGWSTMPYCEI